MILANDTRKVYMLCSDTEIFMLCIPAFQFKLVGIIDNNLQIYDPGRLIQTIKIRNIKVKE